MADREDPRQRPTIKNADVPSDTAGLPSVGEGASARHFARDTVEGEVDDHPDDDDAPKADALPEPAEHRRKEEGVSGSQKSVERNDKGV